MYKRQRNGRHQITKSIPACSICYCRYRFYSVWNLLSFNVPWALKSGCLEWVETCADDFSKRSVHSAPTRFISRTHSLCCCLQSNRELRNNWEMFISQCLCILNWKIWFDIMQQLTLWFSSKLIHQRNWFRTS